MRKIIIISLLIVLAHTQYYDDEDSTYQQPPYQQDIQFQDINDDEYSQNNGTNDTNDDNNFDVSHTDENSSPNFNFGPVGGNLLRCIVEIGKVVADGIQIAVQLKSGNYDVLNNLREVITKFTPVMTECANPICLTEAKKRCESSTGKQCEQWGLIMYPKCPEGTQPFGCCLCVPKCPEGFRNDGLFCAKPAPYGRGAGYPWKFGDGLNLDGARNRCNKDNQLGCEQWGAIIYPKCKPGFHNVACCVCSPDCPAEMTDIGVSCLKKIHGRGVGYAMKFDDCSNNTDNAPINVDNTNLSDQQLNTQIIDTTNLLQSTQKDTIKSLPVIRKLAGLYAQLDNRLSKKK